MSSEAQNRARWHTDLAERDRTARRQTLAHAEDAAEPLLERRLQTLLGELHVLRAAVARRDVLLRQQTAVLRDQTAALRERETRLRAFETAETHARALPQHHRTPGPLRRLRRAVGRYVRAGLSQR